MDLLARGALRSSDRFVDSFRSGSQPVEPPSSVRGSILFSNNRFKQTLILKTALNKSSDLCVMDLQHQINCRRCGRKLDKHILVDIIVCMEVTCDVYEPGAYPA